MTFLKMNSQGKVLGQLFKPTAAAPLLNWKSGF